MPGPFSFLKPSDADQTGYDASFNGQTIGIQRVSEVVLSGRGCDDLKVRLNDSSVADVAEPDSMEINQRRFRLTGMKEGGAFLEAKDGSDTVVAFMQVHVSQPPPSLGPPVSGAPRTAGQNRTTSMATLRTSPFPVAYADFSPDPTLQAALNAATAREPNELKNITTAVVALNPDGTRPLAHYRGSEVHYGASLIKIAAMYAAFELRATLRSIANELGGSARPSDVLKQASDYLDPKIMAKVATLSPIAGVSPGFALPRYASTFDVIPKSGVPGFTVNFSSRYQTALEKMIGPSSNNDAASCVHGVGYGYLNGSLAAGGFFDPGTKNGIWLAGDYQDPDRPGKYPAFRIPCGNDVDTAQGATALQLARLMALLWDKRLVGPGASSEMLALLTLPDAGERYSELGASTNFKVMHVKIGFGALDPTKGGGKVLSEGSIVKHLASGRVFATGWLNLPNWDGDRSEPISYRLATTFDKYLNP